MRIDFFEPFWLVVFQHQQNCEIGLWSECSIFCSWFSLMRVSESEHGLRINYLSTSQSSARVTFNPTSQSAFARARAEYKMHHSLLRA